MSAGRSRVEQRDYLMTALGMLADPVRRLIDDLEGSRSTVAYIEAQFQSDYLAFREMLKGACRIDQHVLDYELNQASNASHELISAIRECRNQSNTQANIKTHFERRLAEARAAIRAIPCDDPGTILPSASPFQTYSRLRAICASAGTRLDILDPYLTADVFHRYLADVDAKVQITIVTSEKVMSPKKPEDFPRRDRIVAVSGLLAVERPATYRFLVTNQQHDRHCRADNTILHLGGSAAQASVSAPYTISNLDPNESNNGFLDAIISGAAEWFGPSVKKHRKS